jgi:thiamine biosynthesis lipoprotein
MRRVLIPAAIDRDVLASPAAAVVERLQGETMGTTWSVALRRPIGLALAEIRQRIERELDRIVAEMSHWLPGSDLDRFNNAAAGTWHRLPERFWTVLAFALDLAERSNGAYDPTIGRLVDLWGFGPRSAPPCLPPEHEIARALAASGWHRVVLCHAQRKARQPGGLRLDLSSVAKGYAVDAVMGCLDDLGVTHALVEIGGELKGAGVKPDGTPWWVALEPPPAPGSDVVRPPPTVVALHGFAVATSGDYCRYLEIEGRRFAHTIDPRTGRPLANAPAAVTVLHTSCMQADALSTLLTVLGPEAGMAYAEEQKLAALFVVRDGNGLSERASSAFAAMLT